MVKVYAAEVSPLMDDRLYRKLYDRAPFDRRAKADRFRFQKDKLLSIGVWSLLCHALQEEGIPKFTVEQRENSKPYLAGVPGLYFNLSHSERMVMCAVAELEVGCDVEKKTAIDPALAEYTMTAGERERIYSFQECSEQEEMFFRIWTLKESYMKATGLGMKLAPVTFGMTFDDGTIGIRGQENSRKYFFKEYNLNDGYCYSCCSASERFMEDIIKVDLKELCE